MNRLLHHISSLLAAAVIPLFLAGVVLHVHDALADPWLDDPDCVDCVCYAQTQGYNCTDGKVACYDSSSGCFCVGENDDWSCIYKSNPN